MSDPKGAAGTAWHTDVSSEARPPSISMLRMEVVPPVGGDTLFMDMRQVFSNLSAKMQDLLKQLSARHDPVGHYLYLSGQKALHELPSGHHPIVRQIPETGDVALYVNEGSPVASMGSLNPNPSSCFGSFLTPSAPAFLRKSE